MKRLMELRDKRARAITAARELVDHAENENRSVTEDEQRQIDAHLTESDKHQVEIESRQKLIDAEKTLAASHIEGQGGEQRSPQAPEAELRMKAFRNLILNGAHMLSGDEARALSAGTDTAGGFLQAPQEFVAQLIARVKDLTFIRQEATVIPLTNSGSCGAPSLDNDVDDADWTAEVQNVNEDKGLAFGKRELTPHPLSKLVKVSLKLLRIAALNPESIVMDRLAYKFGITCEKAYMVGDGVQKPLGVFVASKDGIYTDRDVTGAGTDAPNTTTTIGADGLIATKYALKAQYMNKAKWLFHRDAIKQVATLKTGDGYYLFELSDTPNVPDMLLGRPMMMSEYAPNTFTTGKYVGIFGDFSHYWIADSLALQFQRLNELFRLTNQVGFIGNLETDGMPTLSEAFARVTLQ